MRLSIRWQSLLVPAFLAICQAAPSEDAPFTIEQILSSPFPSLMTASPQGDRLAWVMNERGSRNIWIAQAPDYPGKRLTQQRKDNGRTISQLAWTPDGRHLTYVSGDGANRAGELPNPLHSADGTEQAIWIVSASDGSQRRLAQGASPTVHPEGKGVAFLKRGQIWWVDLQGEDGEEPEPLQLIHARGGAASLRWSPDGSRLAWVSQRGTHSFIGIFERAGGEVRYIDPSLDRDSSPVWSPDGAKIAFVRIPSDGLRPMAFVPRRTGLPWSIRVADIGTGEVSEAWRAREGKGSVFRGISAQDQLFWLGGGLVFPWERDGWTHLYHLERPGAQARLLTPGEFEVEEVVADLDGRSLLISSNQGDIDRRHVWRVSPYGRPQQLTRGESVNWRPSPLAEGAIGMIGSSALDPARPLLLAGDASEPALLAAHSMPSDFPLQHLVEPSEVVFSAADGMPIRGQLFLPRTPNTGDRGPAVIFFHGGSRRQMLLGWHYMSYYHNCYAFNQYLASRGYTVLSVNYRSGVGYGMEFREAIDYGAAGASEFNDVLGAGLYMRSRKDVDPDRIGLWGGSYGGYLTAMGLARASDLFAAGVDVHGVHDWNVVIRNFIPQYDPPQAVKSKAFDSSPVSSLDSWRSPVLLIHGDDDRNVPFSESVHLVGELRKRKVEVEQLVFPDEVHGFLLHRSWLRAFSAAADFLDRRLGSQAEPTESR